MYIKSLPENERPVEKARRYGIECLSNTELLALIIHTGTRNKSAIELAQEVLSIFEEGISGLGSCSAEVLEKVGGIGNHKAATIMAAVELGKRIATSISPDRFAVESSDDVAGLFMEELRYKKKEYFYSLLVDSKGQIIEKNNVSIGELSSTVVHPREVFNQAVLKSASAVIFVHNHPSGDPSPSDEDIETTKRLAKGGNILGIRVLDHIIIGDGRYSSLRSLGYLE